MRIASSQMRGRRANSSESGSFPSQITLVAISKTRNCSYCKEQCLLLRFVSVKQFLVPCQDAYACCASLCCRYSRSIRQFLDEAFEQHERQERQQIVARLPTRDGSGDGLEHNGDQSRVVLERALAQLEEEEELVRNAMRAQGDSPESEPLEGATPAPQETQ